MVILLQIVINHKLQSQQVSILYIIYTSLYLYDFDLSLVVFYPRWWLEAVGYFTHPGNKDPRAILFSSNPFTQISSVSIEVATISCLLTATVFALFGYQYAKYKFNRNGYEVIGVQSVGDIQL